MSIGARGAALSLNLRTPRTESNYIRILSKIPKTILSKFVCRGFANLLLYNRRPGPDHERTADVSEAMIWWATTN